MQQKKTYTLVGLIFVTSSAIIMVSSRAQANENSTDAMQQSFVQAIHSIIDQAPGLQQNQEPTPMGNKQKKAKKNKKKKAKGNDNIQDDDGIDDITDGEDLEDDENEGVDEDEKNMIDDLKNNEGEKIMENKEQEPKGYCEKDKGDPKEEPKCPKSAKFCFWNNTCYEADDDVIAFYGAFETNFSDDQAPLSFRKRKHTNRVEVWSKKNYEGDCAVIGKQDKARRAPTLPFAVRSARTIKKGKKSLCKGGEL